MKTNYNQNRKNNLYNKEECPMCHYTFVRGYDATSAIKCPSCKETFVSGQKINHGSDCQVCQSRFGCNNQFYKDGCPPLMSDGRFITYHNSTNELTEAMRKMNKIDSPNAFRNFMQNNGNLFMNAERDHIVKNNSCTPSMACSEGWYNLWENNKGNWANANQN